MLSSMSSGIYDMAWNTAIYIISECDQSDKISSKSIYDQNQNKYLRKKLSWKTLRDSLPKNEYSAINYSPSCHSKPVRALFIFGTKLRYFWWNHKSFLTLHRQQGNYHVQGQRIRTSIKLSIKLHFWVNYAFNSKGMQVVIPSLTYICSCLKQKVTLFCLISQKTRLAVASQVNLA